MILFQSWLFGHGGDKAAAAPEIRTVQAAIPNYPEPPLPVAAPPLPPPAPRPPARRLAVSRPDPRPTQIAFNVTPQGEPALGWFADGRRPHLAHGCALRPGASIIRAVLETTIHSEVGGQAIAQVAEDVYDADRVGRLLIPAVGSALLLLVGGAGMGAGSDAGLGTLAGICVSRLLVGAIAAGRWVGRGFTGAFSENELWRSSRRSARRFSNCGRRSRRSSRSG